MPNPAGTPKSYGDRAAVVHRECLIERRIDANVVVRAEHEPCREVVDLAGSVEHDADQGERRRAVVLPGPEPAEDAIGKARVRRRVAAGGEARGDRKQTDAGQRDVLLLGQPGADQRGERRGARVVGEHAAIDEGIAAGHPGNVVRREIDRCRSAGHHGIDHLRVRHPGDVRKIVEQPRPPLPPPDGATALS